MGTRTKNIRREKAVKPRFRFTNYRKAPLDRAEYQRVQRKDSRVRRAGVAKSKYYYRKRAPRIVRQSKKKNGYSVYHSNTYNSGRYYQVVLTIKWIKGSKFSVQKGYSYRRKITDNTISSARQQAFYNSYSFCPFSPSSYKIISEHYLFYSKQ
jgi:hypothetical protein